MSGQVRTKGPKTARGRRAETESLQIRVDQTIADLFLPVSHITVEATVDGDITVVYPPHLPAASAGRNGPGYSFPRVPAAFLTRTGVWAAINSCSALSQ